MEVQVALCQPNVDSLCVVSADTSQEWKIWEMQARGIPPSVPTKENVGVHEEAETLLVTRKRTLRNMFLSQNKKSIRTMWGP